MFSRVRTRTMSEIIWLSGQGKASRGVTVTEIVLISRVDTARVLI